MEGIAVQHLTVAHVADGLGVSWNTANDAVLAEGRRVLIDGPGRFDGVAVVGRRALEAGGIRPQLHPGL
jgi:hypothetical protein